MPTGWLRRALPHLGHRGVGQFHAVQAAEDEPGCGPGVRDAERPFRNPVLDQPFEQGYQPG